MIAWAPVLSEQDEANARIFGRARSVRLSPSDDQERDAGPVVHVQRGMSAAGRSLKSSGSRQAMSDAI